VKNQSPVLLLIFLAFGLSSCIPSSPSSQDNSLSTTHIPAPPLKRLSQEIYGLDVLNMNVLQASFQPNQFLSDVLTAHNVSPNKIHEMAINTSIFDVRKMRAGNPFTIIKGQNERVNYFIYEKNKSDYVVYDLRDGVNIYEGQKPIIKQEGEVSGLISSSLYEAIQEQGGDISLAAELENTYAWSIDFFQLQKGDFFKVIYEEAFVDGESLGVSRILGAQFRHANKDFFAVEFTQDSVPDYFDEVGNSLRKAFLKAPLRYSRISSRFSYRRFHPVLKRYKAHLGTDYAAPRGTPIYAVGDGVITHASRSRNNGNYVKIQHNTMFATQYLHMSGFAKGIKSGTFVKQGDTIGYVGSTGLATGPHVCFRFWKNGKQINPKTVEAPPSEPITEENLSRYTQTKDEVLSRLLQIPVAEVPTEKILAMDLVKK